MHERLPLTLSAYRMLSASLAPLAPALVSRRLKHGKEHVERVDERYGESRMARPPGPLVWVHCASVGELLAVIPLIGRIRERDFAVLCTSGTVTSANLAEQRLPSGAFHQFVALDAPRFVKRFFDHWRPDLALFVESDLWPNLIMTSAGRGIPLILVNGRLSESSFKRWRFMPGTINALLRCFDLCLAQSAAHAGRLRDLGAPRIATTGNLKLDVPEPPADADSLAALKAAIGERTVIAGASTHAGEETVLIEAHRRLRASFPTLLTIIVPRHPERGPGILEIAHAADLEERCVRAGSCPRPTPTSMRRIRWEARPDLPAGSHRIRRRVACQSRRREFDQLIKLGAATAWAAHLEFRRDLCRARQIAWCRAGHRRRQACGSRRSLAQGRRRAQRRGCGRT